MNKSVATGLTDSVASDLKAVKAAAAAQRLSVSAYVRRSLVRQLVADGRAP